MKNKLGSWIVRPLKALRALIDRLSPAEEDAARARARNVGPDGEFPSLEERKSLR